MDDKRIEILKNAKVSKAILAQAIPATVGLVVSALYVMVDSMYVSWLGTDYAGAAQVIFPLTNLMSAIGFVFGVGGGTYIARLLGYGDFDSANKATSTSYFLALLSSLIFSSLAFIFMPQIVVVFGAKEPFIQELSIIYGRILMIGSFFQIQNVCFNNMLRSEGSVKLSMSSMIIASIINLVLDPILIFGLDMGIAGAAIATAFSQFINFILLFSVYLRKKAICRISYKLYESTKKMYYEIFSIGIPTFFKQALQALSIVVLNTLAVTLAANNGLAAIGNATKSITIITFIIFGYGQGYQPLCGFCYGAKNYKRMKDATVHALKVSMIMGIIIMVGLLIGGDLLILMFKPTKEVLEIGSAYLKFQTLSLLIAGIVNTISIYYMAIANSKVSAFLSIARQGIFFLPLALILPLIFKDSLMTLYLIQPIADWITLIASLILFIPETKKINYLIKKQESNYTK